MNTPKVASGSFACPDRFFPFFFGVAEKSGLPPQRKTVYHSKEKRKKAVWPRETKLVVR